ncbi:hemerythrin domain-containing protein [Sphingomonas sp.]|jgi:hypothetical protein|uniref:hemerythrin domain-containing protein n=1 Tax=Sphingomonas sp. TaxID=28214 RepID=UPI002D8071CF|nr:hemerythrin domain-containing protein [Sphingomonas sp.]HEU0044214.1 hemerythrin domain-containing protein [Sphingomonas sp.]
MKSIAEQDAAEMGGRGSVLSRQKQDHVKLDCLLNQLGGTPAPEQGRLLLRIYRLVFPHAFAEEAVLWPVIRRALPDGEQLTLQVELEHQEINELATQLERLRPGSPEHQQVLSRIVSLLRQDVRDEEEKLLPRLQAALSPAELRRLGFAWEAVRWIAPTRAHPIVARRPPGNLLSALPLALLDRCRDGIDVLLHSGAGPAAPPLRALDRAFTGTSHAVERLPGMRSGEHPATRLGSRSTWGWTVAAIVAVGASVMAVAQQNRRS